MRRLLHLLCLLLLISSLPALAQDKPAVPATAPASAAASPDSAASDSAALDSASPEVARAEAAMLKSDWKTAEPILNTWLAAHPADAHGLFDAGYVADAEGREADAEALYRKAIEADPKSFEAQISLGLLLARLHRPLEARPALEAATSLGSAAGDPAPSDPAARARAWRALAQIEMHSVDGKPNAEQASADLVEALKLTPETPEDTLMAASVAESTGDAAGAEAAYRRYLKMQPDSAVASAGLAHLLIAQKKYPEAEELLQTVRKTARDDAALTAQLAAVLVAEDKADALPLLKDFHASHPQEAAITRMLAEVEADAGEYAESDQLYATLLTGNPRDADLLTGHGQNLIRMRRYPEALKTFQSATEIDQTNGDAWNGMAFAAFQTHQPEITLHALTMRSKYLPEGATIFFLWATAYDTLHDKKQAAAYYHKFLDVSAGKYPDQEWQARQRLALVEKSP